MGGLKTSPGGEYSEKMGGASEKIEKITPKEVEYESKRFEVSSDTNKLAKLVLGNKESNKFKQMSVKHNYIDPGDLLVKRPTVKSSKIDKRSVEDKKVEAMGIFDTIEGLHNLNYINATDFKSTIHKELKLALNNYNPKEMLAEMKNVFTAIRSGKNIYGSVKSFLVDKILTKFPALNIAMVGEKILKRLIVKGGNRKESKETVKEKIIYKYSNPRFTIDGLLEIHFSEKQIKTTKVYKGNKEINKKVISKKLDNKVGAGMGKRKGNYKQSNYKFTFKIPNNLKSKLISLSKYSGSVSCDVFIKKLLGKIPETKKIVPSNGVIGVGKVIKMTNPNGKWHVAYSLGGGRYIFGTRSDGANKFGIRKTTFNKMKKLFPGYDDIKSN